MAEERLQKFLSECSVASRRKSEQLILEGRVYVNGKKASLGDKVNPKKDVVTVNGKKVSQVKEKYYIMLNKPRGYVTTMSDELGRKCVKELVEGVGAVVYPIGRLDRDSEGLLLLTNDGEFANHIMHPSKHISKTYRVTVRSSVSAEQIEKLSDGAIVIDEREVLPAEIHVLEKSETRSVLQMTIFEGRNRQIRKMCEAVGLEVARLKRTAVGSVKLGMLRTGDWRELSEDEIKKLSS
ncbi:MAG: pseudouridine synthase [Oscillospiraceae bacterium]|nr:pseudouridine synthase [Oscillospiraceae bacterium]